MEEATESKEEVDEQAEASCSEMRRFVLDWSEAGAPPGRLIVVSELAINRGSISVESALTTD